MVVFPNAKINIGLFVQRKRPDGFHDLSTVFYPIPLYDALEVRQAPAWKFTNTGVPIPGESHENLVYKAWGVLQQDFNLPPVEVHLHKTIPLGAGLGGGSSDGAFMLKALNKEFTLGLSERELLYYARKLGSDCPFFIRNKTALGTGKGDELSSFVLVLRNYFLVLVYPGIHVPTAGAYSQVSPRTRELDWQEALLANPAQWHGVVTNDFEASVFPQYPALPTIKNALYAAGADYAAMSGSGSAVYGIFREKPDLGASLRRYRHWVLPLDDPFAILNQAAL